MKDNILYIFVIIISVYYIVGAGILRIGFSSQKTQRLISRIGEGPTRIFYILIGLTFLILTYLKIR